LQIVQHPHLRVLLARPPGEIHPIAKLGGTVTDRGEIKMRLLVASEGESLARSSRTSTKGVTHTHAVRVGERILGGAAKIQRGCILRSMIGHARAEAFEKFRLAI
jgi:hypothetical protein